MNGQAFFDFFNSNFFVSLSTILTIGGAVIIFLWEKTQAKQQIAILLINQIRNAEAGISKLKEHKNDLEFPVIPILPLNSWNEYSHLFAKDFDQDDMQQITNFFSIAQKIEYIVQKGNKIDRFLDHIYLRTGAIQNKIMDILESSPDQATAKQRHDQFVDKLDAGTHHYAPAGFKNELNDLLQGYSAILGTHAGTKFKSIANIKV